MKTINTSRGSVGRNCNGLSQDILNSNPRPEGKSTGFTLIEFLTVIAVIGILASLLLPALSKAKMTARALECRNNLKQFALAWMIYSQENEDRLPPNNCGHAYFRKDDHWVNGTLAVWGSRWPDNTNTAHLSSSLLAPYLGSLAVWRCPSASCKGERLPLVRSVSMNGWLNCRMSPDEFYGLTWTPYKIIYRTSDMISPAPSGTFVFLDERADSINDDFYYLPMAFRNRGAALINFPASYHNGAGNLSFADGHTEGHKWRDPRTNPRMKRDVYLDLTQSPNNPDVQWLQSHATGLK